MLPVPVSIKHELFSLADSILEKLHESHRGKTTCVSSPGFYAQSYDCSHELCMHPDCREFREQLQDLKRRSDVDCFIESFYPDDDH